MNITLETLKNSALNNANLSEKLQERFKGVFPSWPIMIATLIALALVILMMFFLVYKPIKKSIKKRQDYIQSNIDQAQATNEVSKQKLNEANQKLIKAHEEARGIVKNAKVKAEGVVLKYTSDAHRESKRILDEAKLNINQQRQALLEESKNKVAQAASELARKILQREISKSTEKEIIDNFLESKN